MFARLQTFVCAGRDGWDTPLSAPSFEPAGRASGGHGPVVGGACALTCRGRWLSGRAVSPGVSELFPLNPWDLMSPRTHFCGDGQSLPHSGKRPWARTRRRHRPGSASLCPGRGGWRPVPTLRGGGQRPGFQPPHLLLPQRMSLHSPVLRIRSHSLSCALYARFRLLLSVQMRPGLPSCDRNSLPCRLPLAPSSPVPA